MKDFEFVDEGNTFFCSVETPRHEGMPPWWFFKLNSADTTRYAPFEASATDTPQNVKPRIIAYYAQVLAIKARPVHPRPAWRKPERPEAMTAVAAPAPTPPAAEIAG
jgi:hypothetical protein